MPYMLETTRRERRIMITRNRYDLEGDTAYEGLSTDTKPTENVVQNSLFLELDTGDFYYFDGSDWQKVGA